MTHKVFLYHERRTDMYFTYQQEESFLLDMLRNEPHLANNTILTLYDAQAVWDQYPAHTPWLVEIIERLLVQYPEAATWIEVRTLRDPAYYIYEDEGISKLVTMEMMCDADSPTEI